MIDTQTIQKIRQQTGAGIMDVKKALTEANGDENKALEILRKMGQKIAAKKQAERSADNGLVEAYVHANGKVGSMVILACETDFVAKNEEFKNLAHDIALQVAGMNPKYISSADVPQEEISKEREFYLAEMTNENKPQEIMDKIIDGKLNKYYEQVCLLNQKFIKDDEKTVEQVINEATAKIGEKITIKKIVRFEV